MNIRRLLVAFLVVTVLAPVVQAVGQEVHAAAKQRIAALVAGAYQEAVGGFPCKMGGHGKPKMLRWQDVDRCVNRAANNVSWDRLTSDLQTVRTETGNPGLQEFLATVQAAFDTQSIPFEKVLRVKGKKVYLPLTNSVLRFLPEGSLLQSPVIERRGNELGKFGGVFHFERTGGLSMSNSYRLAMFQYTDRRGNLVPASKELLLDSYGVPWDVAAPQRGFRLTVDRLQLK